ncbi:NADH:flavin oxidoreductase/NADH oxidase [Daedalea quercina L-15889]|uniref:NADH:flavin oxidoreductase/NADH oxidase n=1 Tax=Daedalea quercina L-15889 TaxID=1314783 RepID=A0A165LA90_9APHY|nr:NADH:flavin oxidoreductase/NADH oxidase [Daedalea quercina L-15889]
MSTPVVPKLFLPAMVGKHVLSHRIVLAPLTRFRASKEHVPSELAPEYYAQRGATPGTLLITEATFISPFAGGLDRVPGIWNDEQVSAWKSVTDAVHEKGSRIFCQLWALGRGANPEVLDAEDLPYVSASEYKSTAHGRTTRALTTEEIKDYIEAYTEAAVNAIRAGFDGVELHGANGYLIDQFLQDIINKRTDKYGGSIENRARFPLEVVNSIVQAIGADKTAIRLSPWGFIQDTRMKDPKPTFAYFVSQLAQKHSDLAYIHVVEPRVSGQVTREVPPGESNDYLRSIWKPRPFISAGGHTRESAFEFAQRHGDLVAFGRLYISNASPDLPIRIAKDISLAKGNRETYYTAGPVGYIDYAFAEDAFAT